MFTRSLAGCLFACHALAGSGLTAVGQEPSCPGGRPPLTQFGTRLRDGRQLRTDLTVEFPATPAIRYLRLRLTLEGNGRGWWLVVRNFSGRAINIFDQTSFGPPRPEELGRRVRWTDRIAGSFARVDLFHAAAGPMPVIRLDEYVAMVAE